jgi:exopolysaccharide production protein ExoZ
MAKMAVKMTSGPRLESIECARGFAALAVVLLHCGSMMSPEQYSGKEGLGGFFNFGKYGVDFFFVLSGFIIYSASSDYFNRPERFLPFVIRRLFRILPAYWFVLAVGLFVNLFQRERVLLSPEFIAKQVFLADNPLWLGPAWTLQFEFLFYIVFALGIIHVRVMLAASFFWLAMIIFRGLVFGGVAHEDLFGIISNPYCMLFWVGMIAARQRKVGGVWVALVFCFGLILSFIGSVLVDNFAELAFRVGIGAIFGSFLIFVLKCEGRGLKVPKTFLYLGSISYSLYISHIIFVGMTYAVVARIGLYSRLHEVVLTMLAVLVCLLVASLIHRYIELPFISYGRRCESWLLKKSVQRN